MPAEAQAPFGNSHQQPPQPNADTATPMVRHRSAADPNHSDLNALPADTSASKRKAVPLQRTPQSNNTQQKFYHQRGYSGRALKANGMQDVPEVRYTIYLNPDPNQFQNIKLPISSEHHSWVRWYDYNTDAGVHDSVLIRPNGYQVLAPDSVTGSNAGFYARQPSVTDSVLFKFSIQDTTHPQRHYTIACDISVYTDTVSTPTRIVEPTLSRRVIYDIYPLNAFWDHDPQILTNIINHVPLDTINLYAPAGKPLCLALPYQLFMYSPDPGNPTAPGTYILKDEDDGTVLKTGIFKPFDAVQIPPLSRGEHTITLEYRTFQSGSQINTIKLALFNIDARDRSEVGPAMEDNISPMHTQDFLRTHGKRIAYQDFDFGHILDTNYTPYPNPLPFDACSYGFAYPGKPSQRNSDTTHTNSFPMSGEYQLINATRNTNTVNIPTLINHNPRGASFGRFLYVNPTPGNNTVLNIPLAIKSSICPGTEVTVSAFVADMSGFVIGSDFDYSLYFTLQGLKRDAQGAEIWHNIGRSFAATPDRWGSTSNLEGNWQHIVFPVTIDNSDGKPYEHYRLRITCPTGNEQNIFSPRYRPKFAIDDVEVFQDKSKDQGEIRMVHKYAQTQDPRVYCIVRFPQNVIKRVNDRDTGEDLYYRVLIPVDPHDPEAVNPNFEWPAEMDYINHVTDYSENLAYGSITYSDLHFPQSHSVLHLTKVNSFWKEFMNDRRPISGTTLFWSIENTMHGNDTAVYIVHALDPNATFNDSTTFFDNTAYKLRYCFNDPNDLTVPDCSREDQDTLKTPLYTTLNYTTLSQNSSNFQDSLIFGNDGCYAALGAEVTGYFYFDQIQDLVYEHHPCVSSYLRGDISNDAISQNLYNASRQEILTALRKLWNSDTMPQTIAGSGLTEKEFVLLHRLQRAGLLQLQRQGIMIPLKAEDLTYNLFAIDYEPNATYATNTLYIPDTILTYRHGVPSAYVSADQIIFGNNAFQSIPKEVQNYEPVIRVGRYNRILLPIFSATPGTFIKGVYLTETNNPDFQTLMPSVYKPANHPTVHPTRWNPADALSYPFGNNNAFLEIPLYPEWEWKWDGGGYTYYFTVEVGHDTTISHQSRVIGETRFCVKTVPDTLIWQPLAGSNNSWNADFNWRKANGDTAGNYTAATAGEGFVPMTTRLYDFMRIFVPGSYVIVPPQADGNYPVLPPDSNSIHHQNNIYNQAMNTEVGAQPFITYDQNYSNAGASKIAFGAGSMIQNQSALQQSLPPKDLEPSITDATGFYVDMPLLSRRWNFVSSPLEDTYTGDFYFADDAAADTLPFNLRPLGTRQTHPVWFRYYSDSVENVTNGRTTPSYPTPNGAHRPTTWAPRSMEEAVPYGLSTRLILQRTTHRSSCDCPKQTPFTTITNATAAATSPNSKWCKKTRQAAS